MALTEIREKWFFFKYSLVKSNAVPYFREVLHNQHLQRDELEQLNWDRTKALLKYAHDKVPYYKRRFDAIGLHPNDIVHPDDYCGVPVLTREDLKEHFDDLVSIDAKPWQLRLSTTGGSTGEPVKVYHDKRVVRAAMEWRMLRWWGLSPAANFASVYRNFRSTWTAWLANTLISWPTRQIRLNAAALDPASMMKFIKQFNRVRPGILHGYVGAVDHLASFIQDNSLFVTPPKAIWVTSSPLTKVQEHRIEEVFGAPVYDQYGCCEVYWLAAECPAKQGLHMFHDVRRIEFLDETNTPCKEGQMGKVAITDLENYLFPIIRYLNGDMGRALPGTCCCGVTLPLMDKVRGRVSDSLKLPNGKCINGVYLTTIFDDNPDAVKQFQVYQRSDYSIQILVVPNPRCPRLENILIQVANKIRKNVNEQVPIEFKKTVEIPQNGGKLRFVISDVR